MIYWPSRSSSIGRALCRTRECIENRCTGRSRWDRSHPRLLPHLPNSMEDAPCAAGMRLPSASLDFPGRSGDDTATNQVGKPRRSERMRREGSQFRGRLLRFPPHGSLRLQRRFAPLIVADADGVEHRGNEDLAVADAPGARGSGNSLNGFLLELLGDNHF